MFNLVDWSKESFPEDLQFEALVDVLRGRVKVNIHCYQAGMFSLVFACFVTKACAQLIWMVLSA
jgi:hypothetical protein